ncbi:hypothetical protein [Pasteuria penetrans]|uniref:hypothetical protein n=1 Tax=Pasteuria penetrans TaxID=86005 RepID=UPI000FAF4093|nr:hypothetical protein [Pasteuria penetrans]
MRLATYIVRSKFLRVSTMPQPPGRLGWVVGERIVDAELVWNLPGFREKWAEILRPSKPIWPATLGQYLCLPPFIRSTWLCFLGEFLTHHEYGDEVEGEPLALHLEEVDLLPPWPLRTISWHRDEQEGTEGEPLNSVLPHPVLVGCYADLPLSTVDTKIQVDLGMAAAVAKAGSSSPVSTLGGYTLWASLRTEHSPDHLCLGPWLTTDSSLPPTLAWEVSVQGREVTSGQNDLFLCLDSLQPVRTSAWGARQANIGDALGVRWATFFVEPGEEWMFRVDGLGILAPRLAIRIGVG